MALTPSMAGLSPAGLYRLSPVTMSVAKSQALLRESQFVHGHRLGMSQSPRVHLEAVNRNAAAILEGTQVTENQRVPLKLVVGRWEVHSVDPNDDAGRI